MDDCITPDKWATVTSKEHWEHIQAQEKKTQINSSNQSQSDGTAVAGPPATVQVLTQAQTQQPQEQQSGQQNPGRHFDQATSMVHIEDFC